MLRREHELETVGPRLEVGLRFFREVCGMIIQHDEKAGFSAVSLMDLLQQFRELLAAVAIFDAGVDLSSQ